MSSLQPNGDPVVEAFVREHFVHLDTNDEAIIAGDFAAQAHVVDAFPPFIWSGADAVADWWGDLRAATRPVGLDRVKFELEEFLRVFAAGDLAFVAVRASAIVSGPSFAVQPKGILTLALRREDAAWKIASWNWGGPPAELVSQ